MSSNNLRTTAEQSKASATSQTAVAQVITPVASILPTDPTTASQQSLIDKAKAFLTKSISTGSKIQYWHVGLGVILLFVLYVEFMADRKTQRKLKFW
ncbi:MAG: hypothetical protein DI535_31075 [Citrobacter freundii]|nr:MAG: hypothetical protein DI535_31075 [Citrobacter freundii]